MNIYHLNIFFGLVGLMTFCRSSFQQDVGLRGNSSGNNVICSFQWLSGWFLKLLTDTALTISLGNHVIHSPLTEITAQFRGDRVAFFNRENQAKAETGHVLYWLPPNLSPPKINKHHI